MNKVMAEMDLSPKVENTAKNARGKTCNVRG